MILLIVASATQTVIMSLDDVDVITASQAETYAPFEPDLWLDPGASMELSTTLDLPVTIMSIPGHTEGSLIVQARSTVIVGDLLRGSLTGRSARVHFYLCDLDDNVADLRALLDDVAPDGHTSFVGHFGPLEREAVEALVDSL